MSKRALALLAVFLVAVATLVAGFVLVGKAPDAALWLIIGGVVLLVLGFLGIGFLRPMPTDEDLERARTSGRGGSGGPSPLASIFDAFR